MKFLLLKFLLVLTNLFILIYLGNLIKGHFSSNANIISWASVFHMLCFIWLLLRGFFWLYTMVSNEMWSTAGFYMLYWIPAPIEFGSFMMLPLYVAQSLYPDTWKSYWGVILLVYGTIICGLVIFQTLWALLAAFESIDSCAKNDDDNPTKTAQTDDDYAINPAIPCFHTEFSSDAFRVISAICFLFLSLVQSGYGIQLFYRDDKKRPTTKLIDTSPTVLAFVNAVLVVSFATHALYQILAIFDIYIIPDIPLQGYGDIPLVIFLMFELWDYIPAILVLMLVTGSTYKRNVRNSNSEVESRGYLSTLLDSDNKFKSSYGSILGFFSTSAYNSPYHQLNNHSNNNNDDDDSNSDDDDLIHYNHAVNRHHSTQPRSDVESNLIPTNSNTNTSARSIEMANSKSRGSNNSSRNNSKNNSYTNMDSNDISNLLKIPNLLDRDHISGVLSYTTPTVIARSSSLHSTLSANLLDSPGSSVGTNSQNISCANGGTVNNSNSNTAMTPLAATTNNASANVGMNTSSLLMYYHQKKRRGSSLGSSDGLNSSSETSSKNNSLNTKVNTNTNTSAVSSAAMNTAGAGYYSSGGSISPVNQGSNQQQNLLSFHSLNNTTNTKNNNNNHNNHNNEFVSMPAIFNDNTATDTSNTHMNTPQVKWGVDTIVEAPTANNSTTTSQTSSFGNLLQHNHSFTGSSAKVSGANYHEVITNSTVGSRLSGVYIDDEHGIDSPKQMSSKQISSHNSKHTAASTVDTTLSTKNTNNSSKTTASTSSTTNANASSSTSINTNMNAYSNSETVDGDADDELDNNDIEPNTATSTLTSNNYGNKSNHITSASDSFIRYEFLNEPGISGPFASTNTANFWRVNRSKSSSPRVCVSTSTIPKSPQRFKQLKRNNTQPVLKAQRRSSSSTSKRILDEQDQIQFLQQAPPPMLHQYVTNTTNASLNTSSSNSWKPSAAVLGVNPAQPTPSPTPTPSVQPPPIQPHIPDFRFTNTSTNNMIIINNDTVAPRPTRPTPNYPAMQLDLNSSMHSSPPVSTGLNDSMTSSTNASPSLFYGSYSQEFILMQRAQASANNVSNASANNYTNNVTSNAAPLASTSSLGFDADSEQSTSNKYNDFNNNKTTIENNAQIVNSKTTTGLSDNVSTAGVANTTTATTTDFNIPTSNIRSNRTTRTLKQKNSESILPECDD